MNLVLQLSGKVGSDLTRHDDHDLDMQTHGLRGPPKAQEVQQRPPPEGEEAESFLAWFCSPYDCKAWRS